MKIKILIFLSFVISVFFSSCNNSDTTVLGNWVVKANFEGAPRANGTSFAINNFGYWGMGKYIDGEEYYLSDFWKYDPSKNTWIEVDSFLGTRRAYNISISNGIKGYVGLGYDGTNDLDDFWEYDPTNGKWTQLADFPGGEREMATAFAIGSDIYVGTGYDRKNKTYFNDFYKYSSGVWSKISGLGGDKRSLAQSIGVNEKGYVISGFRSVTGELFTDLREFNPIDTIWKNLNKLNDTDFGGNTAIARYNASIFISESKIYLVGGNSGQSSLASCFEWDPKSLKWTEKTSIEGPARQGAGCFMINGYGYIVGGNNGTYYLDDCYKFEPSVEKIEDDN